MNSQAHLYNVNPFSKTKKSLLFQDFFVFRRIVKKL